MSQHAHPQSPDPDLFDDGTFARFAAESAGRALLNVRLDTIPTSELRAKGDSVGQQVLATLLAEHRAGDAVLSEEAADDGQRLWAGRVWIIDPLDGTREFGELDRDDWGVHVALWSAGELLAGAVALPAADAVFATDVPPVLPPRDSDARPRIAVSRTRPPDFVPDLADQLGADLVPMGSAGAKVMAVVTGDVDAYVHAGGQYEWDSAAPVAVAHAAGLHASRLDGSALTYNQPNPYLPDLVVCRTEFAAPILDFLRDR